jgi:hypothetical protein
MLATKGAADLYTDDALLLAKLKSEYDLEIESKGEQQTENEQAIEAFRTNGPWDIVDMPSTQEVTLTRTFGNETFVALVIVLGFIANLSSVSRSNAPSATSNL